MVSHIASEASVGASGTDVTSFLTAELCSVVLSWKICDFGSLASENQD